MTDNTDTPLTDADIWTNDDRTEWVSLDRYRDLERQLAECVSKADAARAIWDTDCLLERADRIDALDKLGITPDLLTKGQNNE